MVDEKNRKMHSKIYSKFELPSPFEEGRFHQTRVASVSPSGRLDSLLAVGRFVTLRPSVNGSSTSCPTTRLRQEPTSHENRLTMLHNPVNVKTCQANPGNPKILDPGTVLFKPRGGSAQQPPNDIVGRKMNSPNSNIHFLSAMSSRLTDPF